MHSFTHAVHEEARGTGVRVMLVCPGYTRTELHERAGLGDTNLPEFVWQEADTVVDAALRDLDRGRSVSIPARSTRPPPRSRACRRPGSRGASPAWSSSDRGEHDAERHQRGAAPVLSRPARHRRRRRRLRLPARRQHRRRTAAHRRHRRRVLPTGRVPPRRLRPRPRGDRARAPAAGRSLRDAMRGALHRRRAACGHHGLPGGALPRRPAGPLPPRRAPHRRGGGDLQPPRPRRGGRVVRGRVRLPAGHARHQARAGARGADACSRRTA